MQRRAFTILLALWWAVWAGLVLPGHTRGAIAVDGSRASAAVPLLFATLPSCCESKAPVDSKPPPSNGNCLFCKVLSHVGIAAAPPTILSPTTSVALISLRLYSQRPTGPFIPTFLGRGPPTSPTSLL